jgi:hypothetical protein
MQKLNLYTPNPRRDGLFWIIAALLLLLSLQVNAQGNYNPNAAPAWQLRGNSIQGDMWLGTRNNRSLEFRTNGNPAAKLDSLRRLYLYRVDVDPAPDSVLTIKTDGQVMKAPYNPGGLSPAPQNGLNDTISGLTELGGPLIRNTIVKTEQYNLEFLADKVKSSPFRNVYFNALVPNGQASVLYNNSNNLNLAVSIPGGETKAYTPFNTYNEMALPKANWNGQYPLVNYHGSIARSVGGSGVNGTVGSVINSLITTTYDAFVGSTVPLITKYIDIWTGYRTRYRDYWSDNNRFTTRIGILINGAADTTTIPNYADLFLTTEQTVNQAALTNPPTGVWGIYQETRKPNLLRGITTFDNTSHIKLPSGNTAQRPSSPAVADIRYNTDSTALELYSGSWKKLLQYTQQPAIADPAGGSVVDIEARAAIVSILTTLRAVGIIAP